MSIFDLTDSTGEMAKKAGVDGGDVQFFAHPFVYYSLIESING